MQNVNEYFNRDLDYTKGAVEERVQYNYIKKTGVFDVEVVNVIGKTFNSGGAGASLELKVIGTEDLIVADLYLANAQGEVSFGDGILRGLTGLAFGRATKVKWKEYEYKSFGDTHKGYNIPALIGKKVKVKCQVEKKFYTNKDDEDVPTINIAIKRVFNMEGQTLTEWENEKEAKVIITESRLVKDKYVKCTKEEWEEAWEAIHSESTDDGSEDEVIVIDEVLPSLEDSTDEDTTPVVEAPVVEEDVKVGTDTVEAATEEDGTVNLDIDIDGIDLTEVGL